MTSIYGSRVNKKDGGRFCAVQIWLSHRKSIERSCKAYAKLREVKQKRPGSVTNSQLFQKELSRACESASTLGICSIVLNDLLSGKIFAL